MERIIKIDEALYNRVKEKVVALSDIPVLCKAVDDSTPYDQSGDLISREALIKKLEEMANNEWNIQVGSSKGLEDAIDVVENAEAVEITEEQAIDKLHETGWLIEHDKEMTTRPQGDCISREALKGVIETYRPALIYNNKTDMKNRMVDYFLDEIDNAQAIPLPSNQIAWEQGYEVGLAQGKQERTKGEWIYHDKLNMYFCKDCGLLEPFTKEEIEEGIKLPNFCQQCGADMRKGGAE